MTTTSLHCIALSTSAPADGRSLATFRPTSVWPRLRRMVARHLSALSVGNETPSQRAMSGISPVDRSRR